MSKTENELDYKDPIKRKEFVKHLLNDLEAFEHMLNEDMFERQKTRIGLEQEFCLIDYSLRPMMQNLEFLRKINDSHFTTELAMFNVEINLDPRKLRGKCLSKYENDLVLLLTKANKQAHKMGGKVILSGILPTIKESDISIDNITPKQRYLALNEIMTKVRGKEFEFNIQGIDELITKTDSVLFESCNTSFQIHFQIDPHKFKEYYNWSKVISGPVMACCVNSPMFLGKRLWKETRIALFHQSTDIRKSDSSIREERPRVFFGNTWEKGGIVEHYKENLSRFKILVTKEIESNSLHDLEEGKVPDLDALALHNGTIYKWNRACFGTTDGKPHLRIEVRYIPSGPTIVDEIANAAFWIGLMNGMPEKYENIDEKMNFDDVKSNFFKAAQFGISTQFKWLGNKMISAQELILNEMLAIAENGLKKANIDGSDIDKYLGIIKDRVRSERTGAQWMLDSYAGLKEGSSVEERISAITEGLYKRQKSGSPVHKWKLAEFEESGGWKSRYWKIGQVMTTDLITVGPEELIDFVKNIMIWSNVRHIPVENDKGELIGMISSDTLLGFYGSENRQQLDDVEAKEIMEKDPITVSPETLTVDAIKLMRQNESSCLSVVDNGKLVGLFTEKDYIKFGDQLFEELIQGSKKIDDK